MAVSTERFCPSCGNSRNGTLAFCAACGREFDPVSVAQRSSTPSTPEPMGFMSVHTAQVADGGWSRYLPTRTRDRLGLGALILGLLAGYVHAANDYFCLGQACYASYSTIGAIEYAVLNGLLLAGLFYVVAFVVAIVQSLVRPSESETAADSLAAAGSTFARHRVVWLLVGLATVVMPLAWPFGIYIIWKVYATRHVSAQRV
jgi:hypothetical protein